MAENKIDLTFDVLANNLRLFLRVDSFISFLIYCYYDSVYNYN